MASSFNRSYGGTSNETKTNDHSTTDYVYNPYRDFQVPIESLYRLPTSPEFLFQEEATVHRRSASENITFYTGSAYLAGALAGAGKGVFDGVRTSEPGDTLKLRVNRVLNASGDTGRRFGNRFGAIGLIYSIMESAIVHYRDSDDGLNTVLAGLGTGAFYRAASGPRSAAIAGAIGGVAAGLAVVGKQVVKRYVPI